MFHEVVKSLFCGFQIEGIQGYVFHLQFADDTLVISKKIEENVLAIKVILQLFEVASRLKVSLHKSQLVGVGIQETQMNQEAELLHCKIGSLPFKYLGFPIMVNYKRLAAWEPMVENMKKRLVSWDSKHILFGGRVVLLKFVLVSLLIYFLSSEHLQVLLLPLKAYLKNFFGGRGVVWIKGRFVRQHGISRVLKRRMRVWG